MSFRCLPEAIAYMQSAGACPSGRERRSTGSAIHFISARLGSQQEGSFKCQVGDLQRACLDAPAVYKDKHISRGVRFDKPGLRALLYGAQLWFTASLPTLWRSKDYDVILLPNLETPTG